MSETTKDWSKPMDVDQVTLAFPANGPDYTPGKEDMTEDFWLNPSSPDARLHHDAAHALFDRFHGSGSGLSRFQLNLREGIDNDRVDRHLQVVLRSFALKHEHKISGAAWLMKQWMHVSRAP